MKQISKLNKLISSMKTGKYINKINVINHISALQKQMKKYFSKINLANNKCLGRLNLHKYFIQENKKCNS